MSYKSLHTLSDCGKHGAVLCITCGCRRQVWRGPNDFIRPPPGRIAVRGWTPIEVLAKMLVCRCGRKGMRIYIEVNPRVPAGVPVLQFLNADDREQKRLVRIARG